MKNSGLLQELPSPPAGKTGWPWTEETPPGRYKYGENYPRITIVTPSFNQGMFIEETIRSVLLQNYPNLEYIIIDAGSNDETVSIMERYAPWLTHWVSEPDRGQSHAINKGLARMTGDVFNWLNSDDYYMPAALATVGEGFADSKCKAFLGYVKNISPKEEVYRTRFRDLEETIAFGNLVQPSAFFRAEIMNELSGVNETLHYLMDSELWLKYLLRYGIAGVQLTDDTLVRFRLHEQSKTVSLRPRFLREKFMLLHRVAEITELSADTLSLLGRQFPLEERPASMLATSSLVEPDKERLRSFLLYVAATKVHLLGMPEELELLNAAINPSVLSKKQRRKLLFMKHAKTTALIKKVLKW